MFKKILKKFLICILFSFISISVYAKNNTNYLCKIANSAFKTDFMEEINEKSKFLDEFEIESLRDESTKHFRLSDGSYKLISYNQKVHKLKENKWVDIDNTLEADNDYYYSSDNYKLKIYKSTKNFTFLEYNDIELSIYHSNFIEPIVINDYKNLSSKIVYNNIIDNINLELDLYLNNLLFHLDLVRLDDLNNLSFYINKAHNKLYINDLGYLVIYHNNFEYIISNPVIKEFEDINIEYNIIEKEDGYYIRFNYDSAFNELENISVEFIYSESLSRSSLTNSYLYDTYVTSSDPNTVKGSDTRMVTYTNNSKFSLVKTDLPELPSTSTIYNAILTVPYYFYQNGNNYVNVGCYNVTSSWNESSVTWNTKPSVSSILVDSDTAYANYASSSSPEELNFDITDCVDDWYTTRLNNYGVALKYENGTYNEIRFKTKESVTYRSTLTIYYTLSSLLVEEGTYFIKNGHLSKYMQVDDNDSNNNYSSNGAKMEVWDFDGEDYQKWKFVYLHNGYYKIINKKSNKVLAVDDGYENTGEHYLVQESYTGSRRQQWQVTLTSHNLYKIKPKSSNSYSTDWVMALGEGIGGNGRNVEQREYSNNTIYKDEWILVKLEFKYVNFYDSTFVGDSFLINNITASNSFSKYVFNKLYYVNMVMDGLATQFENAVADNCTHSTNVPCSETDCGTDCNNHHRNYHNMTNQLYNNGILTNHIYIMWSNRDSNTYCHENSSGNHETVTSIACVCDSKPIIIFLSICGSNNEQKIACMTLNIVHESAHTFGMDDVYDVSGHDVAGEYVCIMERFERDYAYQFYQDIMSGDTDPFCASCKSSIESLIYQDIVS